MPRKKLDEPTGLDLDYFDFFEALKRPKAQPGDWILGFSNQFEIAMRDEQWADLFADDDLRDIDRLAFPQKLLQQRPCGLHAR